MLSNRSFRIGRHLPLLSPDNDGGGTSPPASPPASPPPPPPDPPKDDLDAIDGLGDKGKEAIRKEREARAESDKEVKRLKKIVDDAEAATKQREAAEAKAKGDFEKLAEDRQVEIDRLTADAKKRDRDDLRITIADRHKLPKALALRLAGETEAELDADAKELAKLVKPPVAADTEAGDRHRGAPNGLDRTKPGENAELVKAGASYTFMPVGAVPVPDDV